jgi:EAL domain-containing protein (putative c-di-GMP-specific phosphodiesterase class I)/GGDEF domain-containing protein
MENTIKKMTTFDNLPGAVIIYKGDTSGEILYANSAAVELFQCQTIEEFYDFSGRSFRGLVSPEDLEATSLSIKKQISKNPSYARVLYQVLTKENQLIYVEDHRKLVSDETLGNIYYACLVHSEKNSEEVDSVTGFPLRQNLKKTLDDKRRDLALGSDLPEVVIYFNLLRFKTYNLYYGFDEGDQFLKRTADILRDVFPDEMISRFSDDRFVVFYRGVDEFQKIKEVHDRVLTITDDFNAYINAGIYYSNSSEDFETICDYAKIACDSIKSIDNTFCAVYTDDLRDKLQLKSFISDNIDNAIKKGDIKVYYQPVIRTLNGKLCGMEALTRWVDPNYGLISPADFIPVLEDANLIYKLDLYVIEEVCRHLRDLSNQGRPIVPVSLNISRLDFTMCDPFKELESAIIKYRLLREWVCVEITESAVSFDEATIRSAITTFHDGGIEVWMDDFGSGYSSLNVLKEYDFDQVKFDMLFIRNMNEKTKDILSSSVQMLKKLGVHTLAEGVETKEQFEFIKAIGCEKAQGYLYGKPAPYEEMLANLEDKGVLIETALDKMLYEKVGLVDLITEESLALFHFDGSNFKTLFMNDNYWMPIGIPKSEVINYAEGLMNFSDSMLRKSILNLAEKARESNESESLDCTYGGRYYRLTLKNVGENKESCVFKTSLVDITFNETINRTKSLNAVTRNILSLYTLVYVLDYDKEIAELVYTDLSEDVSGSGITDFRDLVESIIPLEMIYADDRDLFQKLLSLSYIQEELARTKRGNFTHTLRVKRKDGNFEWHNISIQTLSDAHSKRYLLSVKRSEIEDELDSDGLVNRILNLEESPKNHTEELSESVLWTNLVKNVGIKLFWKDSDRCFIGASQSFLDYYGFKSIDDIKGKTDEDLKWHIEDDKFRKDEEAVLNQGKIIRNSPGKNIIKGVVRNIFATKYPIYQNGKIEGLMGYFIDPEVVMPSSDDIKNAIFVDPTTGLMNIMGFVSTSFQYEDNYRLNKEDYAMITLKIPAYEQIEEIHGKDVAEEMMSLVVEKLRHHFKSEATISRIGSWHFAIIEKKVSQQEIKERMEACVQDIMNIRYIGNHRCTLYVDYKIVLGSQEENHLSNLNLINLDMLVQSTND